MNSEEERKAKSLRAFKDWIKIRARAENRMPLEIIREIQFMLDQEKEKKEKENSGGPQPKKREVYFDNPKFRARLSEKNAQLRKEMEERHRKMSQGQNPYEER